MPKQTKGHYFMRNSEDILQAVFLFCQYHDLIHQYIKKGVIKSSLDRGAFVRPQDLLPPEVMAL
jgi:hypothetical protein